MSESEKRYYSVVCKCGHVGAHKFYIPIEFAVMAASKKEAAEKARWFPRCKHHHKDCVLKVKQLTFSEFCSLNEKNGRDPYLQCHSIQEQRVLNLADRIVPEISETRDYKRNKERSTYVYGKTIIRHPKQFMKNVLRTQEACCY